MPATMACPLRHSRRGVTSGSACDMFRIDESGQFAFLDRRKDALRRRGENISSFEVEQHLVALPHIEEAAVVAVPSDESEDEIKTVLVLTPRVEFDPVETLRQLIDQMPYFMVPRFLQVVDHLPKTQTLKVRKADLRTTAYSDNVWDCQAAGIPYHAERTGRVWLTGVRGSLPSQLPRKWHCCRPARPRPRARSRPRYSADRSVVPAPCTNGGSRSMPKRKPSTEELLLHS